MKEFKNKKTITKKYYAVSTDTGLGKGEIEQIHINELPNVLKERQYKFSLTYDGYDHPTYFPCEIIEETIVTYKTYKDI